MNHDLSNLNHDLQGVSKDVRANFTSITPEQLNWKPSASEVDSGVVHRFLKFQPKIASAMERCDKVDIVMGSPAAAVITYSLLDAFRIVVRHEQRNLLQAKRVLGRLR